MTFGGNAVSRIDTNGAFMKTNDQKPLLDRFIEEIKNNLLYVIVFSVTIIIGILVKFINDLTNLYEFIAPVIGPACVRWGVALLCSIAGGITVRFLIIRHCYEPQFEDNPLQALRKAKRSRASMTQVVLDENLDHYFIYRKKRNQFWIAPTIRYRWMLGAISETTEQDFEKQLINEYDSKESCYASRIFELVEKAVRGGEIEVFWNQGKGDSRVGPIRKKLSMEQLLDKEHSLIPIERERSRE